jgi:hypothetical protein
MKIASPTTAVNGQALDTFACFLSAAGLWCGSGPQRMDGCVLVQRTARHPQKPTLQEFNHSLVSAAVAIFI